MTQKIISPLLFALLFIASNTFLQAQIVSPQINDKQETQGTTPKLSMTRTNVPDPPVCASSHQETVVFKDEGGMTDATEVVLNFGDGSASETKTWLEIKNANYTITHPYTKTSCGNTATWSPDPNTEIVLCENCFVISATVKNTDGASIALASPLDVRVKNTAETKFSFLNDDILLENGIYYACDSVYDIANESLAAANMVKGAIEYECNRETDVSWTIVKVDDGSTVYSKNYTHLDTDLPQDSCVDVQTVEILDRGTYEITLTQGNAECGTNSITKTLEVQFPPEVEFTILDSITCYPSNFFFINESTAEVEKFVWDFGDGSISDTIAAKEDSEHYYTDGGEYTIVLHGKNKVCWNSKDTLIILERLCQDLYVPNAFIPESDQELFRYFKPVAQNLVEYRMEIYNVQGRRLWVSEEVRAGMPVEGWDGTFDGKPCVQGTYIWKIFAKIDDGTPGGRVWEGQLDKTDKKRPVGTLTLIR